MPLDENFNKDYLKDKAAYKKLDKLKEFKKRTEGELKTLKRYKEDLEIIKKRAIEDKDKAKEETITQTLKRTEEEIKKKEESLAKANEKISKSKEKINSYIQELYKDPEFKVQVNSILEKRYNRKMQKDIHEKEQIDQMIDLCDKHPSLANNLKGMIRAKEETEKLLDELKNLDPITDKARIDEINNIEIPKFESKKEINKNAYMEFCAKNNINIDKKFLETLITERQNKKDGEKDFSFAHDKATGEIKLSKTLNRISKSYDKRIDIHKRAIEKIPGAKIWAQQPDNAGKGKQPDNAGKGKQPDNAGKEKNSNLPAKQFEWWQIRKRFNAWREARRVAKNQPTTKVTTNPLEASKKFRDAYKYDVVKDHINRMEEFIDKEVRKEQKQSKSDDKSR